MIRILVFCLCFAAALFGEKELSPEIQKTAVPNWVTKVDLPLSPDVSSRPSMGYLLLDRQAHVPLDACFLRRAIRVNDETGVQDYSNVSIDFDPSYEQLEMHVLQVIRNGELIDKLDLSRAQVIQQEKSLDRLIYNGTQSLVFFLEDIRKGDILEWSYSLRGSPSPKRKYFDVISLQFGVPVNKIYHRLVHPQDTPLFIQHEHGAREAVRTKISPDLEELVWETDYVPAGRGEAQQPEWFYNNPQVVLSQYVSWAEVAKEANSHFLMHERFDPASAPALHELVASWKKEKALPSQRVVQAIRFVQDEIRYLGIETSSRLFVPAAPEEVLRQRFGDCKDKTMLLKALLHLMDVPAKPCLVHSFMGKTLSDRHPSPHFFNHVILLVELGGRSYFVDPTLMLQGGGIKTLYCPNYDWGLLLDDQTAALTQIPGSGLPIRIDLDSQYQLRADQPTILKMRTDYEGRSAEWIRYLSRTQGNEEIGEYTKEYLGKVYPGIRAACEPKIEDDRALNRLTLYEEFFIEKLPTQGEDQLVYVFPQVLSSYIDLQFSVPRSTPLALSYPVQIKERLKIEADNCLIGAKKEQHIGRD